MRTRGVVVTTAAALLLLSGAAEAQRTDRGFRGRQNTETAGQISFGAVVATPMGELDSFFDAGFGAEFSGAVAIGGEGRIRMRGQLGFLNYGIERQRYCYGVPIGCRVDVDVTTSNNIFYGGIGPEIAFPSGRLEPYAYGSVGVSAFVTSSSLGNDHHGHDLGSTTHLSDANLAWTAGGGLRVQVSEGRKPVFLDLGIDRHVNGETDFLTKGDILDHPDGSITIFPNRSIANLMTFRVGVTIGIPRRGRGRN